ncbi:MAG TPA: hypothetical protein VLE53_12715 [Gemmatimonadaceae bacterium]|nr:hypothetical protein [Gemmatimonadaceae bacterium]
MHRIPATLAALALAALAFATAAEGQGSTTRQRNAPASAADKRFTGWTFGVHTVAAPGIQIDGEDVSGFETKGGSGAGVMVGYGFNPMFTGFASFDVAKQGSAMNDIEGSFGLVHLEVGVRAQLPMRNAKTVPYASASIGRRALGARVYDYDFDEEYDLSLSGTMFGLGGGIKHFLSSRTALDAGLTLGFGAFNNIEDDGEKFTVNVNGSTSVRLRIGVTWHPGTR